MNDTLRAIVTTAWADIPQELPPTAAGRCSLLARTIARTVSHNTPLEIYDAKDLVNELAFGFGLYVRTSSDPDQTKHERIQRWDSEVQCVTVTVCAIATNRDTPDDAHHVLAQGYAQSYDDAFSLAQLRAEATAITALFNLPISEAVPIAASTPDPFPTPKPARPRSTVTAEQRADLRAILQERAMDEAPFVKEHSRGFCESLDDTKLKTPDINRMRKALGLTEPKTPTIKNPNDPASDPQRTTIGSLLAERNLNCETFFAAEFGIAAIADADSPNLTKGIASGAIDKLLNMPKPPSGTSKQSSARLRLAALLQAIPEAKHPDLFTKHGCTNLDDIPSEAVGNAMVADATAYIQWLHKQTRRPQMSDAFAPEAIIY